MLSLDFVRFACVDSRISVTIKGVYRQSYGRRRKIFARDA